MLKLHWNSFQKQVLQTAISFHPVCAGMYGLSYSFIHLQEIELYMKNVAHGRVLTSSHQITEVKQRRAGLVLGWVTVARVTLPAMCTGVGQAFHIMPPLSTQQWWVPDGMKDGELWMAIAAENVLNSPQRRWNCTRESSNTRGVNCEVCWTRWDIRL